MQLVKDIFKILDRGERRRLSQLVLLDVVVSILDVAFLAALLFVVKFYTEPVHNFQLPDAFSKNPLLLIITFFFLFGLKNLFGYTVYKLQSGFTYNVASRLSKNNLENYLHGSFSDYVNVDSSAHVRRISQEPIEFCHYIVGGLQQIISQTLLILITIVTILVYNPVIFPLLFAILAPPVLIVGWMQKRKLERVRERAKSSRKTTIQYLQEALSGYVESNLYQRNPFFVDRYHRSQVQFNQFLASQQVVQNLPSRLIEVFAVFGLFILVLLTMSYGSSGFIQLITLGAFMAAAYKIIPGIVKIMNASGQMKTYAFTLKDLLKEENKTLQRAVVAQAEISRIEFRNVSFNYQNKDVLSKFSFSIEPGDFIGLSGISGKGKTTIINLLLGFIQPSSGSILINGRNLSAADRQHYWNRVSYIKQQPFFIHDTAIKNVVLTDGDYDEGKFDMATRISGFQTFINGDANKLIRENGKNISGGQRQRIAFARALYKDFDLLFLDEPFSEMDESSEMQMVQQLKALSEKGKMIFLVTHNKSSLKYCSKTIRLDEN
jgi:ABC-type multidrug transport system fused ATPase/permease subunit